MEQRAGGKRRNGESEREWRCGGADGTESWREEEERREREGVEMWRRVLKELQFLEGFVGETKEKGVAVVNPGSNEAVNKDGSGVRSERRVEDGSGVRSERRTEQYCGGESKQSG
ncbi:hypothetical protein WMY93_032926 [Mugilogobius chulae]|uniref:Uncharacterized protein n=1 Tax=Mugilogobius chulae TaxID=88201 RepID=A0AAW0MIG6_9GOBI